MGGWLERLPWHCFAPYLEVRDRLRELGAARGDRDALARGDHHRVRLERGAVARVGERAFVLFGRVVLGHLLARRFVVAGRRAAEA